LLHLIGIVAETKRYLRIETKVYNEAKKLKPERWAKDIKNWDFIKMASLNSDKSKVIVEKTSVKNI
jgi:hypothetical protein